MRDIAQSEQGVGYAAHLVRKGQDREHIKRIVDALCRHHQQRAAVIVLLARATGMLIRLPLEGFDRHIDRGRRVRGRRVAIGHYPPCIHSVNPYALGSTDQLCREHRLSTYHLFISHSWSYSDTHDNLVRLLRAQPGFDFKNYSVPSHNPIVGARTDKELEEAIENKIRPCSAVLIMAGMYSTYSMWINKEIAIAKRMGKVIIAVKPFGAERISTVVREAADAECAWNSASIVNAIRIHART